MDVSPTQLGAELRRKRHQLGLTQRQAAQRLGGDVAERDIQRIESGQLGLVSLRQLEALLLILGTDLRCFFGGRTDGSDGALQSNESVLPDIQDARNRLQRARQSSQLACQQASELLRASNQLAVQWGQRAALYEPSNSGSLADAPWAQEYQLAEGV